MPDMNGNSEAGDPPPPEGKSKKEDDKKKKEPMSSVGEVMSFVLSLGGSSKLFFVIGCAGALGNGLVYPILAYLFSTAWSGIADYESGLATIRETAYTFMIVGVYALVMASLQTGCLESVAYRASKSFRLQWFQALLRQDPAFFDVYDISGIASTIGPNSRKFQRGIGRKFGEGIQFTTTFLGGIGFAFYSSWRVAFVVLAILPFVSVAAYFTLVLNQTKGARAAKAYSSAGSIAYSAVSSIKTVLSLNATTEMIRQYSEATLEAYRESITILWKQGIANGSMLGTFILLYCVLTLYGTFLLYRDVEDTGCDPSNSVSGNDTCGNSGPDVFGAMLGVAFAAQGVSQVGNFIETFTAARVACYQATIAINRVPGAPVEEILDDTEEDSEDGDVEEGTVRKVKAVLPKYEINALSSEGLKPETVKGAISFKNVSFSYPTRPNSKVLSDFNLEIEPGKTVAIVGPSGGGKSTTVAMIERFYDPASGAVELDGINLKEFNVTHLRRKIGYVGQEPTLFATTIAGNIRYGNPEATQEQVEAAAKMANAHDFVSSFPEGYETQVGDKGAQLSGGQKQRIAIARVLVSNPSILLLDEATSALDSESEIVVQDALDNVLAEHKRTTVVIAHRLSTIRNADVIAVVSGGKVVETGTHDELMAAESGHYRALVDKQEGRTSSMLASRESSEADLSNMDSSNHSGASDAKHLASVAAGSAHFEFRDVKFAYPSRPKKLVLDGFNLTVRTGETIALVGPSGGGKSTTVSLIERFYDPTDGAVAYSGADIKSLNVKWYRDQIGYVGQEPTLFNATIGRNIAYGAPEASQEDIEEAAKMANAHDFIMSFPDGYDTNVGERGAQLSGGQKQRVAIARALVKKPRILLLDEATSALDSESESVVQHALDKLMGSKDHTTIVIAHRLSTIRDVDRIAYIADGVVKEFGSHDTLMEKHKGLYKRLVETQRRGSTIDAKSLRKLGAKKADDKEDDEDEAPDFEAELEKEEKKAFSIQRARKMASPDAFYMLVGSVGSIMAGGVFPSWGILFAETLNLLFTRVVDCETEDDAKGFTSCEDYWDSEANSMRDTSYELSIYWTVVAVGCVLGNMLTFWGFGMASERLNKRVRDSAFASLLRQEVAYFDKRSVGGITSQLEEDAARIHTFSGEPIRSALVALSSVVTGIIISFVYMWPFALLSLGTIPFMGFATEVEMRTMLGEDESDSQDELNSPGGIIVETLLNMRTVSALTLEKARFNDYLAALDKDNQNYVFNSFKTGFTSGMSMFIQQWVNALQLWWGGWLLFNYPTTFSFNDFLVSMFALLFSLFGLGAAFQGMSDRKETEKSAGRVFYLLDRKSEIDPLSEEGKKLD